MSQRKTKRKFLRGQDLVAALSTMPSVSVKFMVGNIAFSIPKDQAITMVKFGTHFEGEFWNGRVYKLREFDPRTPNICIPSYRDGRAMIQPIAVTNKTVDLWTKIFKAKAVAQANASCRHLFHLLRRKKLCKAFEQFGRCN